MVSVRVEGVREARKVLREYRRELRRLVEKAQEAEAEAMVRNLRRASPVVTGEYQGGWRVRESKQKRGRALGRWVVENTVRHGIFVERRIGLLSRETARAGRRIKGRLKRARDEASRRAKRFAKRR